LPLTPPDPLEYEPSMAEPRILAFRLYRVPRWSSIATVGWKYGSPKEPENIFTQNVALFW